MTFYYSILPSVIAYDSMGVFIVQSTYPSLIDPCCSLFCNDFIGWNCELYCKRWSFTFLSKYFSPHFLSGTHQRAWIPPVSLLIRANLRTSLQSHIVPVTSVAAGIRSNTGESKFQIAFAVCFADQRPVTVAQRFKNVFKKDQRL